MHMYTQTHIHTRYYEIESVETEAKSDSKICHLLRLSKNTKQMLHLFSKIKNDFKYQNKIHATKIVIRFKNSILKLEMNWN